ncbi:MAG: pentapeptide repeat-containing protein [Actinobacteria bacterium]|nr:pentapeptide repeat-containing protein [Actinomycetota bacterium]
MLRGRISVFIVTLMAMAMIASGCVEPDGSASPFVGAQCGNPPTLVPGASLFGCSLAGFDLSGLDLSGADLRGADLSGADLSDANLRSADLTGANLTFANLTGADLSGAVLAGAILIGALFINAILTGTSFSFGPVLGADGNGGGAQPAGPECTGPFCPGYNEVDSPTGPGRAVCEPDVGGIFGQGNPEEESDRPFFLVPGAGDLEEAGARSVVTDAATSFAGATFDFSDADGGAWLLSGLNLSRADFTGATFVDTNLACKVLDGGRFAGTRFVADNVMGGMFHISGVGADFAGAEFVSHYFCDVDLSDAQMAASSFTGFIGISCAEFLPNEFYDALPEVLLRLDGADLTNATIGGGPNPLPGPVVVYFSPEIGSHSPGSSAKTSSLLGTNLDGAHLEGVWLNRADFTGASADGVSVSGPSYFRDAIFGQGWTNTTWSGQIDFDGASCPDGSTGSAATPCFAVN